MNVYNNTEGSGVTDINWLSENFSRYRLCFFARSIINFYKIMYFFFTLKPLFKKGLQQIIPMNFYVIMKNYVLIDPNLRTLIKK